MAFDFNNLGNMLNPNAAMRAKGQTVAGGTGPVRVKKGPNLIQSIVGVFVGILLILASPIVMWQAQSQDSAKEFNTAKEISADAEASGYVVIRGEPEFVDPGSPNDCYVENCIWERVSEQELVTKTELVCSSSIQESATVRIIRQNGSECDDDTGECVPCYDVEKDTWEEQRATMVSNDVEIGRYTISPDGANIFDTKETTVETGYNPDSLNDTRNVYTTFVKPSMLLVSGDASGAQIVNGEKPFVLSAYDREATFAKLKSQDQMNMMILFGITFFMLFVGYGMILGPLTWLGRQLKYIPGIGRMLVSGSKSMIGLVSFLLAVVTWIVVWVCVVVLKFWWLSLIIVAGVIGFFIWKAKKGGEATPTAPPPTQEPPQQPPQAPQTPQNPAPPAV